MNQDLEVNKHIEVMERLANKLKNYFPESGIGISGSIAKNTFDERSDIDLLVLDRSFEKNRQYVFYTLENIRVNILCFKPDSIEDKFKQWSIYFTGQHLQFILDTKPLFDKNSLIKEVQEKILSFKKTKLSLKDITDLLSNNLRMQINGKETQNIFCSKKDSFVKLYSLLNVWFINKGIKSKNKTELLNAFKIIEMEDCYLFPIVSSCLKNNTGLNEREFTEQFSKLRISYPFKK